MKARLIYTGIRVKDIDKSVEFYTNVLGMKETGRTRIEATGGETVGLVSEDGGHTSLNSTTTRRGASSRPRTLPGRGSTTSPSRKRQIGDS